jgi:hypothetical protein
MRRALALTVLSAALSIATRATAAPTSKLLYSRSNDASSCPDEEALRQAVADRVGGDRFSPSGTQTIVVSVFRRGSPFVATVALVDESGVSHPRELHVEGSCGELLDAVALAIAIAIDPQSLARSATPPPPPTPSEPVATLPPPAAAPILPPPAPKEQPLGPVGEPSAPMPVRPAPLMIEARTGAVASLGTAPGPAVGLALGAEVRWRALSVALEGRVDAPSSMPASGGGEVSSWLVLGAIVPCFHQGPFFGCLVEQAGSVQTSGSGVSVTHAKSVPWRATGGRVGARLPFSETVEVQIHGDLVANLDPMTLVLDGAQVFKAPPATESLGAGVVFHFR